jgi:hypothetical protein
MVTVEPKCMLLSQTICALLDAGLLQLQYKRVNGLSDGRFDHMTPRGNRRGLTDLCAMFRRRDRFSGMIRRISTGATIVISKQAAVQIKYIV